MLVGQGAGRLPVSRSLIQRLPGNHAHVLHKQAIAQLVNAGASLRRLANEFHHAPVVMKRWGEAVQAGDMDSITAAFSGQGAEKKITPDIAEFIWGQYLALCDVYPDFRQRIIAAVKKRYAKTVSGESLRQIFRLVDMEFGEPAKSAPLSAGDEVVVDNSTASESSPSSVSAPDAAAETPSSDSSVECVPQALPAVVELPVNVPGNGCPKTPGHHPINTNRCVHDPVSVTILPPPHYRPRQ